MIPRSRQQAELPAFILLSITLLIFNERKSPGIPVATVIDREPWLVPVFLPAETSEGPCASSKVGS